MSSKCYSVVPGFLFAIAMPALPCTCVVAADSGAKSAMGNAPTVFHGTVIERRTLPQRSEMKGRGRYAITFRVNEFWKGSLARQVTLYGVDGGTDCLWDGGYVAGKDYLVYAAEVEVKDVTLEDGHFWYGWTDVLPKGAKMLIPEDACMPGGLADRKVLRRDLGKGRIPPKTD